MKAYEFCMLNSGERSIRVSNLKGNDLLVGLNNGLLQIVIVVTLPVREQMTSVRKLKSEGHSRGHP